MENSAREMAWDRTRQTGAFQPSWRAGLPRVHRCRHGHALPLDLSGLRAAVGLDRVPTTRVAASRCASDLVPDRHLVVRVPLEDIILADVVIHENAIKNIHDTTHSREGTMLNRLVVTFVVVGCGLALVAAQCAIRLQFEVYENGTLIAEPAVTVESATTGRVVVERVGTIAFTPALRDANRVAIAFNIQSGGRQLTPRLVLSDEPGSISWAAETGEDAFELRVAWIR